MCAIVHSILGELIPEEVFYALIQKNPHGFGMAIPDGKGAFDFEKELAAPAYSYYKEKANGKEHVAHFRYRSAGVIHPVLCHPFLITNNLSESVKTSGNTKLPLLFQYGTVYNELLLREGTRAINKIGNSLYEMLCERISTASSAVKKLTEICYSFNPMKTSDTYLLALSLAMKESITNIDDIILILKDINKSGSARFILLYDGKIKRIGKFMQVKKHNIFLTGMI